jgi:hypothetical protein
MLFRDTGTDAPVRTTVEILLSAPAQLARGVLARRGQGGLVASVLSLVTRDVKAPLGPAVDLMEKS